LLFLRGLWSHRLVIFYITLSWANSWLVRISVNGRDPPLNWRNASWSFNEISVKFGALDSQNSRNTIGWLLHPRIGVV
jgi:hypothetical protein